MALIARGSLTWSLYVYIIRETHRTAPEAPLAPARRADPKLEALHERGALHPHPERVRDPQFREHEFYDPHDLVQVKYEMLRRVQMDNQPVSETCAAFGLSRPVFYKSQRVLAKEGLPGLVPKKRGPRGAHKLTQEVMKLIGEALAEDRSLRAASLAQLLRERFNLAVHPRTIQRALARRSEKKRPRSRGSR
jgi:transposase